ncbi:right-handed parallel beta-helix repeat-containing protein [Bosea sp. FBZP-16]|uniref:right-handed parallel beta-helix repeat-containing protein n=1 Tax=Bosea sp. FBZP-16 TaxID=2065382 RepID=UPI001319DADA|nr:right-handed parallel beta-helix repeat-containing protein [Bosea sp. FBZP-16]
MATFYVSTTGSDSNTGLDENSSFQTLERAVEAMHQSNGADTVYIAGGTYYVDDALQLTSADSGSSFVAMSGENVVISGGTQVSGWTQGSDGIWTAHVDAQDVQQFTVNGEKQTESRYPDVDPNDPVHGGWLWGQDLPAGYDAQKSMAFDPSDYPDGEQPKAGDTVTVYTENGYASEVLTIASVEGNVMTFTTEANYDLGAASRYYVSQDTPDNVGEWSYDAETQTISYKAPDGFTGEGGVVSGDHSIISIDGADNVTVKGITFTDTASSSGDPTTAAIEVNDANGVVIDGNQFVNVGVGVALHGDSSGNTVSSNSFEHTWSSAIAMTAGTSDNRITNNTVDHSNEVYVQYGSIDMQESAGNQIDHNTITNVPRFGISEVNYDPDNQSGGNTIEYNDIRHSGQQTPDTGAIYLFSADDSGADGSIIRYNTIVDTGGTNTKDGGFAEDWSSGIYLDNMASNAQIYGNFVQGTTFSGILVHGGSNNEIHDNTLLDNGKYGISTIEADGNPVDGNETYNNFIQVSGDGSNTIDTDQTDPSLIHDNVYYNPDGGELTIADVSLASFQRQGGDSGSTETSQAGFTDAANGDYSFVSGSVAQAHGIDSVPFDSVGSALTGTSPEVETPSSGNGSGTPPTTSEPVTETPPVTAEPSTPSEETPTTPATGEGTSPGTSEPGNETPPVTAEPSTPSEEAPTTPATGEGTTPDTSEPGSGNPDVITIPDVDTGTGGTDAETPSNSGGGGWGGHGGWGGLSGGRWSWDGGSSRRGDDDHGGGRNGSRDSQASNDDDTGGGGRNDWRGGQSRHDDDNDHYCHSQLSHWHW